MKVGLLLEELGLPYEAVPVDTRKGLAQVWVDRLSKT
jgi:glutathione S-transferase